jgi:small subunit ribosomal protein S21
MSEVKLRKGDSLERAFKKLRKKIARESTMDEMRKRRYFEKPARKRYEDKKRAKYIQKLKSQEEREDGA